MDNEEDEIMLITEFLYCTERKEHISEVEKKKLEDVFRGIVNKVDECTFKFDRLEVDCGNVTIYLYYPAMHYGPTSLDHISWWISKQYNQNSVSNIKLISGHHLQTR